MAEGFDLHSATQKILSPDEIPQSIEEGLQELQAALPSSYLTCHYWNKDYIAVTLTLSVDLPTGGPINGIDIRAQEPVIFLFHRTRYPRIPPSVYPDRKNFPIHELPHLNVGGAGNPASLCLHRGSLRDWFAEHSIADLVARARSWFRDAASNRLIREEDRFEGTRILEPSGVTIYQPGDLMTHVEGQWESSGGSAGYSFLMATLLKNKSIKEHYAYQISYRIEFPFPIPPTEKMVEVFRRYNRIVGAVPDEDKLLYGLLIWGPRAPVAEYFGSLPSTYGELKEFCVRLNSPLNAAIEAYHSISAQLLGGVPLILALLRPQRLIGSDSPIEYLHLAILGSDEHSGEDGRWKDDAPVLVLSHRNPLTVAFASQLSREEGALSTPFALVGCGAVGSKVSLHLAKAGQCQQTLIDSADLFPHHLVRHGLSPHYVGQNKADALKDYITSMYRLDQDSVKIQSLPTLLDQVLETPEVLDKIPLLIDATASTAVFNDLVLTKALPTGLRYSKCEITDRGQLGILYWEGAERNPRIDDLQAALFNYGQSLQPIASWLARHREELEQERAAMLEEIGIGISCSSATLRLADDIVSAHAAVFAATYKQRHSWLCLKEGRIQISLFLTEDFVKTHSYTLPVHPVMSLTPTNNPSWQVRIQSHVGPQIGALMKRAGKKETGGLLVGLIHKKRKIIYVTDCLPPSKDSRGTPYAFKRGRLDYPQILDSIDASTGGLIGYVGEWHTHPDGPATLSPIDIEAVKQIRKHLNPAGIPTHIMVFGKRDVQSFVFTDEC